MLPFATVLPSGHTLAQTSYTLMPLSLIPPQPVFDGSTGGDTGCYGALFPNFSFTCEKSVVLISPSLL